MNLRTCYAGTLIYDGGADAAIRMIEGQLATGICRAGWQEIVLAHAYWAHGENDQALARLHRLGRLAPGYLPLLAAILANDRQVDKARSAIAAYRALYPGGSLEAFVTKEAQRYQSTSLRQRWIKAMQTVQAA